MSTITEPKTEYTPADLLAMPDGKNYELIDGQLVERTVSALSSWVGLELGSLIHNHSKAHGLGWVFGADLGYQCFPDDPGKFRKPDASFVRTGRLSVEELAEGYVRIAPDLAVEVVSRNDRVYDLEEKVVAYLRAGVRLVWVVYPPMRKVRIERADGSSRILNESDELTGEDVVPGFRCPVGALFPPGPAPQA